MADLTDDQVQDNLSRWTIRNEALHVPTDPTPTDPTAAIEAAKTLKAMPVMPGVGLATVALIHDLADYVLALPTPVPTAKTAAEAAGPHWEVEPCVDGSGQWLVIPSDHAWMTIECNSAAHARAIAAALNAHAPAPVAGEGGLFEGGSWKPSPSVAPLSSPLRSYWVLDRSVGVVHIRSMPNVDFMEVFCDRHGNPLPVPTPGAGSAGGEVGK